MTVQVQLDPIKHKKPDECETGDLTRGDWLYDEGAKFYNSLGDRCADTGSATFVKRGDGSGWERVE